MSDPKALSKTLSFWLRHAPEDGDLHLDDRGWADAEAVLAALARKGLPGGRAELEGVVAGSDKNRFELSEDGARIRARQGHSIPVIGDWTAATPPSRLYHGTVERFLPSIMEQGLQPRSRHHVHLSPDVETASQVGARRGKPVILEIAADDMAASGAAFLLTGNGVWLVDHVPPSALKVVS